MWILVFSKPCFDFFNPFVLLLQIVNSLFHLEKPREKFVFGEFISIHYDHLSRVTGRVSERRPYLEKFN